MGFQAALVNELGSLKMVLDVVGMNMPCGGRAVAVCFICGSL